MAFVAVGSAFLVALLFALVYSAWALRYVTPMNKDPMVVAQIDGLAQQRDAVEAKYDRYREEADVLREKLATVEAMLEERKDPGADYAWGWKDRALAAEAKLAEAEAKLAEAEPVALAEAKLYRYRKEVDVLQAKLLVAQEALEYIDNTDDENNVAAQAMRSVASGALEQIS